MRFLLPFALLAAFGCAHTSQTSKPSAAYNAALDRAFADLAARSGDRQPAGVSDQIEATAAQQFSKTQSFEVVAYPKLMSLAKRDRDPHVSVELGEPVKFQYRIDRQGHCALGTDVVAPENLASCIQVEIKPVVSENHDGQYVRVFMSADYRVYGISYHDLNDSTGNVKTRRKVVKWDPSEPLSSESLSLSNQFIPLDLPIYATNALRAQSSQITIAQGARAGETCNGWKAHYHNTFGSNVRSAWCSSDPWPTEIETDHYLAVLNTKAGN